MIRYLIDGVYPESGLPCFILKDNIPSLKLFTKLGFKIIGEEKFDNQKGISYIMNLKR